VNVGAHRFVLRGLGGLFGMLAAGGGRVGERPFRRASNALALSVAGVLACALQGALFAGVAQAETPKLVSYGNFSSPGASFGVAVDNTSDSSAGDVYVASLFESNISKYDPLGKLESPLSPFGAGYYSGAAVNPTNGDLYVLEALNFVTFGAKLATFTSSGAPVGTPFEVPASRNLNSPYFTAVQIAADSKGNIYVPVVPENKVVEYEAVPQSNAPPNNVLRTFTGTGGAGGGGELKEPTGVAVDSSGNLWVADTGNKRIEELNPTDEPIAEINTGGSGLNQHGEGVESIALDGHGDVFVIVKNNADSCGSLEANEPCSHLVEYDSTGAQIADVGAGSFEYCFKCGRYPPMVAANESTGRVYVTDGSKELVWIFGPPTAPTVSKELTAEVTASEAKLGALVNPGGLATSYRFEYDTREYGEGELPHGNSTPLPEGSVGEGVTARTVWAAASGLEPGTTYHYRVVATNELGRAYGPDHTVTTQTAAQAACSNEQFRGGFFARLPDCRAYELLTPPVKTSVEFDAGVNKQGAGAPAAGGEALPLTTSEPLPDAQAGGGSYVGTRGTDGWILEDIIPLESYTGVVCNEHNDQAGAYSDDISKAVLEIGKNSSASQPEVSNKEACNAEGLEVVPGEPVGYKNLLVRANTTRTYRLVNNLNAAPRGARPADASLRGASADLSHVVFSEAAPLTPNAAYGVEELYEWDEGVVRLVTVLPDGTPVVGSLAQAPISTEHEQVGISTEGSHVLFTSGGSLYDRVAGRRTVEVDKALPVAAGPSGGGVFQGASADGSRVFFTDANQLTAGSTAASKEPDLYECRIVEVAGNLECDLTDVTVAKAGEHANVLDVAPLGAKDSSRVYFSATGVLAEGAKSGEHNLYVDHEGTIAFIATLAPGEHGVGPVSPDGAWFAFVSRKSLTGYENADIGTGLPQNEIFLYSAGSGSHPPTLECASCKPSGEAPTASGAARGLVSSERRPLSDGGRLFFETQEALVPSDTNGQFDVYEYENGQPSLISSGTSDAESTFLGASESGDDAFFGSNQQLVPQDTQPGLRVVYDARSNGGFPSVASPPECTTPEGCRGAASPQASLYGAPASQTFSGLGNLTPPVAAKPAVKTKPTKCKKGYTKNKKARCVKKGKKKSKSKAKRASHNRRVGR
jgi:hypothetical protein